MGRLKSLRRRWLLWWRGECEAEGCTDAPRGFPMFGEFCPHHFDEHMRKLHHKAAAQEFEHEVQVQAEALRRVLPELAELQGEGRRG